MIMPFKRKCDKCGEMFMGTDMIGDPDLCDNCSERPKSKINEPLTMNEWLEHVKKDEPDK